MANKSETVFFSTLNDKFAIPSHPSKCEWHLKKNKNTSYPHTQHDWRRNYKVCPDISHAVGNTPLVKLNKIPQSAGLKCNVYAKCEFLNPGGSAKDRVAKRMIEDAEKHGILKPGMTIIESSSGNAGIALALQAAIKGYGAVIVISEYSVISPEKLAVLNALGAKLVRTPLSEDIDSPNGFIGIATKIRQQIPNSIILDQFSNPASPLSHYDTTAEEILYQLDGKVDMAVMGAGTGGTITGIGRKLKERNPKTKIVGVDPVGSTLAQPEELNSEYAHFEVDGIGFCFVPTVLDRSIVDQWIKTTDKESMIMARRLIREEGLLVGNSSGAALSAALRIGKNLNENQNLVVIFADGVRNYLSTFLQDPWMESRRFTMPVNENDEWWWDTPVKVLDLQQLITVHPRKTCEYVLDVMEVNNLAHIGVRNQDDVLMGIVARKDLTNNILSKQRCLGDPIVDAMISTYSKIDSKSFLGLASRILLIEEYVVVVQKGYSSAIREKPLGIIYNTDLLKYIRRVKNAKNSFPWNSRTL